VRCASNLRQARRTYLSKLAYNPAVRATSPKNSPAGRGAADRCPGALRLAEAADGYLARVRLPGGFVTGEQLRALAGLAAELGDGRVELTSRGNVQLRALSADAAEPLTTALTRAGLLPSLDHDRVRNVLASPLAGLDGLGSGRDLAAIVAALDAGLCARPRLTGLSGRFLFAIDDGRGDVAGLGADVVAVVSADGTAVNGLAVNGLVVDNPAVNRPGTVVGGSVTAIGQDGDDAVVSRLAVNGSLGGGSASDSGADAVPGDVVTVMLAFAEAFLDELAATGSAAWRIADLPDGGERVRAAVAQRFGLAPGPERPVPVTGTRPVGRVRWPVSAGGEVEPGSVTSPGLNSVVLLAPLGRLTAAQVTWLAARVAGRPARITPWRSVVLPGQPDPDQALREAAALGFGVDESSPWLRVTACAGRPGCASALADVQADAAGFAARWPGRIVHVSGCGRHCGRPAATEIDVTATSEGYQIAQV
jgi:precorrin-3B synthase